MYAENNQTNEFILRDYKKFFYGNKVHIQLTALISKPGLR